MKKTCSKSIPTCYNCLKAILQCEYVKRKNKSGGKTEELPSSTNIISHSEDYINSESRCNSLNIQIRNREQDGTEVQTEIQAQNQESDNEITIEDAICDYAAPRFFKSGVPPTHFR